MDIYRENILDHYRNPRNFGELEGADVSHEENNPFCGDRLSFALKVLRPRRIRLWQKGSRLRRPVCRANGTGRGFGGQARLKDIKFSGEGCAISMASASMLTEKVKNMKIERLRKLGKDAILKMLGVQLSPTRLKCALLPLEVLQKAMTKFQAPMTQIQNRFEH